MIRRLAYSEEAPQGGTAAADAAHAAEDAEDAPVSGTAPVLPGGDTDWEAQDWSAAFSGLPAKPGEHQVTPEVLERAEARWPWFAGWHWTRSLEQQNHLEAIDQTVLHAAAARSADRRRFKAWLDGNLVNDELLVPTSLDAADTRIDAANTMPDAFESEQDAPESKADASEAQPDAPEAQPHAPEDVVTDKQVLEKDAAERASTPEEAPSALGESPPVQKVLADSETAAEQEASDAIPDLQQLASEIKAAQASILGWESKTASGDAAASLEPEPEMQSETGPASAPAVQPEPDPEPTPELVPEPVPEPMPVPEPAAQSALEVAPDSAVAAEAGAEGAIDAPNDTAFRAGQEEDPETASGPKSFTAWLRKFRSGPAFEEGPGQAASGPEAGSASRQHAPMQARLDEAPRRSTAEASDLESAKRLSHPAAAAPGYEKPRFDATEDLNALDGMIARQRKRSAHAAASPKRGPVWDESSPSGGPMTQTWARILTEQGKIPEAIAVYEALALRHPEKSGYFAALIQELKAR